MPLAAHVERTESQLRGTKVPGVTSSRCVSGLRRIVEATKTWWPNYGQLRRNTDRNRDTATPRCASPATTILVVGRLIA